MVLVDGDVFVVGVCDGISVGFIVGLIVGTCDGNKLGFAVSIVGHFVVLRDGFSVGCMDTNVG